MESRFVLNLTKAIQGLRDLQRGDATLRRVALSVPIAVDFMSSALVSLSLALVDDIYLDVLFSVSRSVSETAGLKLRSLFGEARENYPLRHVSLSVGAVRAPSIVCSRGMIP